MLIENVEPNKWYSVKEVSEILGWSVDSIRRWIAGGHIVAFIRPGRGSRRIRVYKASRIQGSEVIRFVNANLTAPLPVKTVTLDKAIRMLVG